MIKTIDMSASGIRNYATHDLKSKCHSDVIITPSDQAGGIGMQIVANMDQLTDDYIGALMMGNARENSRSHLDSGQSLKVLRNAPLGQADSAIVIGAGPSLKRNKVAEQIKFQGYKGVIVVTDSALFYCLSNGIVPDLVLVVDPDHKRIIRWFGDPELSQADLDADDYFTRQDMDTDFSDEMRTNAKVLDLLNSYGTQIKVAISTTASPMVVQRIIDIGMELYWWNPMLDAPDKPDGLTKELSSLNGLPCVNAGGNVGSACWMMAHAVLGKKRVALTGIDFSYYDETPYRSTQYYYEIVELVGEDKLDSVFMRIFNPHLQKWFYTDPAYRWYREAFIEMAQDADCITYNCTEGGILFGDRIEFIPFSEFLSHEK